jgi:undecaprenyl-diphosphatase
MSQVDPLVGILAGIVQGIVEWLPVSSQGNLALFLTAVGTDPAMALQLALFLQVGTTLSATAYYRADIWEAIQTVPGWGLDTAYEERNALVSYILVASLMTGLVGIPLYIFAVDFAGQLSGSVFVALIGVLLILTGIFQLKSESVAMGEKQHPTLVDSVLVGAVQGVAILPGISRSGVTSSALLFRSYEPPEAFRLSFLLSIPASIGAAVLTVAGAGGLPGINPDAAVAALLVSAVVGYFMIDAIMRVVERIPFWQVCFGLGGLAMFGGLVVFLT